MPAKAKRATGPKKTLMISGSKFSHKSCSTKKSDAQAAADSVRNKGNKARVIKTDGKYCVYEGGKAKAPFGGRRRTRKK